MNKTITIIGINYYPEDTAIGIYTTQLAEYLSENGFDVTIITGFPYYPAWRIDNAYKRKKRFYKETVNNIAIYRYKQYVPKNPTFFKRILHLSDFTFGSLINIFKVKKTDLVLCIVPFTSTIFPAKILSKLRKAKLWVHIQDFELDAAIESNLVNKSNFLLKALFGIEKLLINSSDAISTISNSMLNKVNQKSKITSTHLLSNWVDIDTINPKKSNKHNYLLSNKFKILYSGNIGEKQNWDFFLKFAKELEKFPDVELIIVGDGAKKDKLILETHKFNHVKYYKPVAYSELSDLLCSTDLHVLFQKENSIDTVMPSKILAMMASETPSIITGNKNSEVAEVIQKSNGGYYFEAADLKSVIFSVDKLMQNPELRAEMGMSAREYVAKHYSSQLILNKFKINFEKILEK